MFWFNSSPKQRNAFFDLLLITKILQKAGIISLLNDTSPAHKKSSTCVATISESLSFLLLMGHLSIFLILMILKQISLCYTIFEMH